MEGEQVDQRNVAALSNSTLADCIFQDGGNISHPTSSSRTFRSPTKNWSLIPLPVNLSRLMTHLLPMECSGSDTAMLLKLHGKSCCVVEHSSYSPEPPCCEKAQRSPGRETTWSGSESGERKRCPARTHMLHPSHHMTARL